MSNVYRPCLAGLKYGGEISYWIQTGTVETIGDRQYVRQTNTLNDDVDSWHETRSGAIDEAALQIEQTAKVLLTQADEMRAEADRLRREVTHA